MYLIDKGIMCVFHGVGVCLNKAAIFQFLRALPSVCMLFVLLKGMKCINSSHVNKELLWNCVETFSRFFTQTFTRFIYVQIEFRSH